MQGHCVIHLQVVSALGTMDITAGRGWQSRARDLSGPPKRCLSF